MKKEKSCGAVIFRRDENRVFYLVEYMIQGHVSLCKGHVENGETEHETASREIREETGLEVKFINGFRKTISYSPYKNCIKDVIYFLAESQQSELRRQPEEISDLKWLEAEEAYEALTYQSDKEVLKSAVHFLNDKYIENR